VGPAFAYTGTTMSLLDSIKASPPRRQMIVIAVVAVTIVAALAAAYIFLIRQPYEVLFTDLRTADAATIVAELDKRKIPYRLKDDGTTILAPRDVIASTRLGIVNADLPLKGAVGFELFNKSDMGLTEFAQKINYQRALQGELARTIMTMDGIETARIHLTIPEPTIFRGDRHPPKASVTLLPRRGQALSAATVRGVQRLVAAAVSDLDVANVVILDEHGAVVSSDVQQEAAASAAGPARQTIEQHYAALIRQSLEAIYPAADLDVAVWADLGVGAAGTDPSVVGAAWPSGPRDFRLRVAVSIAQPLAPEARDQARVLAGEAIGLDPALGDLITVSTTPPRTEPAATTTASAGAPATVAATPLVRERTPVSGLVFGLVLALLAIPIAVVFMVGRRQNFPRGLTAQQRADYTQRLSKLLDKGDANAAPRV